MASACRMFYRKLSSPLPRIISTKLRVPIMELKRHYSHGEPQDNTSPKLGAFAEFYEKTKDNKQCVEEDQDFELLLKNSNFINVTYCPL